MPPDVIGRNLCTLADLSWPGAFLGVAIILAAAAVLIAVLAVLWMVATMVLAMWV